jgi:DNA-binding CsgD family transcriptional regulator
MLVPHLQHALMNVMQLKTGSTVKDDVKLFQPALTAEPKPAVDKSDWRLTPRQLEILKWIYRGKTNSETATILGISELTVRNHIQNLMLKLGVANRTQAVVKAMQNNIFRDEGFNIDNMNAPSSSDMEMP